MRREYSFSASASASPSSGVPSWSDSILVRVGNGLWSPAARCQRVERIRAFGQWRYASSMWTTIIDVGALSRNVDGASRAGSTEISARPLTRRVSSTPGMKKMSPICGFVSRLLIVSSRLFPIRSGMPSVRSSRMRTKPGSSPFGELSAYPSGLDVAMQRNGERSMKARQCSSRRSSCLSSAFCIAGL